MKPFERFAHTGVRSQLETLRDTLKSDDSLEFGSSGEGELTIRGRQFTAYARKYKLEDGWRLVICEGARELNTTHPDSLKNTVAQIRQVMAPGKEVTKITGFGAEDESGYPVLCDAHGNNAAIRCLACGAPVLVVYRSHQRGYSSANLATCVACGSQYWVSASPTRNVLVLHRVGPSSDG